MTNNKYRGVVQFANAKEFNGKTLYSFKLQGDTHYNNCGTSDPVLSKGDYISFNGEMNAKGAVNVDVGSITKGEQDGVAKSAIARNTALRKVVAASSKDSYWENKEIRDVTTQKTIQLQASRNSAIALASAILQAGAVAGYEKAKPAEKTDIITSLVDLLTERFQEQSEAHKTGDKVTTSEPEVVVESVTESSDGKWE